MREVARGRGGALRGIGCLFRVGVWVGVVVFLGVWDWILGKRYPRRLVAWGDGLKHD